jgi:DtxR family transcriptional regulator, Mn-dependent transcriptional regulator
MNLPTILITVSLILLVGLVAIVFWPRKGLAVRWKIWQLAIQRQQIEDALKYIFNLQLENQVATIDALSGALQLPQRKILRLVAQMQSQGLVEQHSGRITLTPAGQSWALQVVRAHRLWERYLADEARVPLDQIHEMAHKLEHKSSPVQIDDLDAALGHPSRDPHGDPIPNAAGVMRQMADETGTTTPLTDWKAGERGKIVHLEDEPPVAYAQLIAEGLHIDQWVTVLESSNERITFTDGQREINIAPAIAANVFVQRPLRTEAELVETIPLSELRSRTSARIVMLDDRCQGFTRRRFLDLGLTPGTEIFPELENSFREPRAYRVRGTLIALRNDQASMILVQPEDSL